MTIEPVPNRMGPAAYEAGFAEQIITPPVGTELAGFFHTRIASRVRDDLHARVIVLRDGDVVAAIVSLELICVDSDFVAKAKALIASETGIDPAHVLMSATHTHTGPEVRLVGNKVERNEAWLAQLPRLIADAVKRASEGRERVTLRVGQVASEGYVFNRLFRLNDGTEQMGSWSRRSEILGPAGPVDPDLQTVSFVDESEAVRAIIFNLGMHGGPTVGGGEADFISADWSGEVARHLRRIYEEDTLPLFLQGSCGDTWPHPYEDSMRTQNGPAKAVALGRGLAGLAAYGAERAEPETRQCLEVLNRTIEIPYYTRTPELLAEVEELKKTADLDAAQAYFIKAIEEWEYDGKTCAVPLQVTRIADLAIVAIPAQIFTCTALEMKQWSPASHTLIVELANARIASYIPTADQVERGAYGSRPIISRWLSTDAARLIADAVLVMLQELWETD